MTQAELLPMLAAHLALTGLPGAAAVAVAAEGGARRPPILLALGLAAAGMVAMLAFWLYYADPLVGETFSYLTLFAAVALLARAALRGTVERSLWRRLAVPAALWALASGFVLYLGFIHGGIETPISTAATRALPGLPSDNDIPRFYAEWFYARGHAGDPPVYPGEWLSSDRPPLQVGFVLAQRPFNWGSPELHYQVLGVVLQQLWVVGLWALLCAAGLRRLTSGLTAVAVLLSSLVLINGFFVWPKLLPAALLLAAAALVITPLWDRARARLPAAALVGALVGLAMMGHGSSVFGILPLALLAALRGMPSPRWIAVAGAALLLLMGSWGAYQKYADPPGNRLTKWMLANAVEVDDRGLTEALVDSYREAGVGGVVDAKLANLEAIVGGAPMVDFGEAALDALGEGDWPEFLGNARVIAFFYLLPSLGLLLLAPAAMAALRGRRGREPAEWGFALRCFAVVALGCLGWALLLFGGEQSTTVIHIGSYLLPILAVCGAVVGLRAVAPGAAIALVAVSSALMLALFAPAVFAPEGSSYSAFAVLACAAFLAGFVALALRRGGGAAA